MPKKPTIEIRLENHPNFKAVLVADNQETAAPAPKPKNHFYDFLVKNI